jgi:hypothetical protein
MPRRLPLIERINTAAQLAIRIRAFYDIWWIYIGMDTRPLYLSTMDEFSEYFRFDEHALRSAIITHVFMLYDPNRRTVGLKHLLDEVEASHRKSTPLSEARNLVDGALPTAKSITDLRHNLFAHRSATHREKDVFTRAGIKPDRIRDLATIP